ncbi:hypothetical protein ICM_04781 [Bacillus cereus BAG1X2-3]|nr:hypothetical protein ICM_04781 [Bacillus cereus BAG1X2-3]
MLNFNKNGSKGNKFGCLTLAENGSKGNKFGYRIYSSKYF